MAGARLAAAAACVVAGLGGRAIAGDFADREIFGFSPDGATFAFEEFGVQDGSGFPYANIYVIDTANDAWASGTPIRVRIDDETAPLSQARSKARALAAPILAERGIGPGGRTVVSNPSTELSADPYAVRFLTDNYANWGNHDWTLTLTPVPLPEPAGCENLGPTQGFRLDLRNWLDETWTLHDDTALPASRGCPQDYAIADVITYFPGESPSGMMIVLIHVISQGFEGPDRRFLAVSAQFNDR